MWQKNNDQTSSEKTQNHFTGYLQSAIKRKRAEYFRKLYLQYEHELLTDDLGLSMVISDQDEIGSFSVLQDLDNILLWSALSTLSDRELYILIERAVEKRDFNDLAFKLNIGYKAVAAIYYRTIKKIKSTMEGGEKV